jgi:small subunit ribosomal protein S21
LTRSPGCQSPRLVFFEGFFDGGDAVEVVFYFFDGEADAVMGYALVDGQFGKGGSYPECLVGALGVDGMDGAEGFDDSGKHGGNFANFDLVQIFIFGNLYVYLQSVNLILIMLIIDSKDCENIDKALKKYKKKFEKAKVLVQLRERQSFTKPSVKRRGEVLKAVYKQQVAAGKFE